MKVLVVGGGGREHAIVTKVKESKRAERIYCVPGNAGIAELAECADISVMDFERIADFACEKQVDLVIVGPDDPLVGGIVDVLEERGL
ncbi:MAG: phosphoribosylamine--glycine ligase, partial [Lachnospiraceae bacterium]|nr:phosphoribosylamine--glycine ligase [Lachnospiraceae bacterium]